MALISYIGGYVPYNGISYSVVCVYVSVLFYEANL
jgi:hypothetical protein